MYSIAMAFYRKPRFEHCMIVQRELSVQGEGRMMRGRIETIFLRQGRCAY
jgi:hypothetical protein